MLVSRIRKVLRQDILLRQSDRDFAGKLEWTADRQYDRSYHSHPSHKDEYPDRISLYKLATDITESIIRDDKETDNMNKEHIGVIVQILLYYEIHKRRYKRTDSFLNF